MIYKTKQLMLDEIIEKLQKAKDEIGNVPVILAIAVEHNELEEPSTYKCVDVLYDEHDVTFYNY